MSSRTRQLYEFGPYCLDATERVLWREGAPVRLTPKEFETLLALVRQSGHVVEKDELLKEIWPDTFVEEATLAQNVFTLRKALGRGEGEQVYIETVPRRGYRFAAGVRERQEEASAPAPVVRDFGEGRAVGGDDDFTAATSAPSLSSADVAASIPARAAALSVDGSRPGSKRAAVFIALAVVFAAAFATFVLFKFVTRPQTSVPRASSSSPHSLFQSMRVTRLPVEGIAREAAISPDGRYVAYIADEGVRQSIWVRQVTTASDTQQIARLSPDLYYGGLAFSRDGDFVYYIGWKNGFEGTLYRVPALGGAAKQILDGINTSVSFSPDGRRFAFVRGRVTGEEPVALIVASADGGSQQTIATRRLPDVFLNPAWSPDGRTIACVSASLADVNAGRGHMSVVAVDAATGEEKAFTPARWFNIDRLAWLTDGAGLVVNAVEEELGPSQLWHLSYPGGEARRITNDLNTYFGASLTGDSATLVTVETDRIVNLWVAPHGEAARAAQITSGAGKFDGYYGVSWTPDGSRLVYASIASGAWDIWTMNADGTGQKQLTVGARSNYGPSVSPDGRHIVFVSNRSGGAFNVWRMDIDGRNPKQLTDGAGENFPHCTPDGRWVVYATVGFSQPNRIWKVSLEGGEPVQLTDRPSSWPFVSPDGRQIAHNYWSEPEAPPKLAVISIEGGAPSKVFDLSRSYRANTVWMPDGRGVTYLDNRGGVNNVWLQPATGGAPQQLTDFKTDGVVAYDWSRGGTLAYARSIETTGIILIRDFR
jgi:Tol biopolymer transport system component/DNA-binding winged helix-turn-helix (wHTH) protein